jgi:hypothetical protein
MMVVMFITTSDPSRPERNSFISWDVAERPHHGSNDPLLPRLR